MFDHICVGFLRLLYITALFEEFSTWPILLKYNFLTGTGDLNVSRAVWNASVEELSHLKQGLLGIFNDSFSRKLVDTKQVTI